MIEMALHGKSLVKSILDFSGVFTISLPPLAVNDIIHRAVIAAYSIMSGALRPVSLRWKATRYGVSMVPWKYGQLLAWDATCPDTLHLLHHTLQLQHSKVEQLLNRQKSTTLTNATFSLQWQ